MHVIWKRPDGFHDASPSDYKVVELGGHSRMWLSLKDQDGYPFRISGGWEEEGASVKLNRLINLLDCSNEAWIACLKDLCAHSSADEPEAFFADLSSWLSGLKKHLKGDVWEVEIMEQAVSCAHEKLSSLKGAFLAVEKS